MKKLLLMALACLGFASAAMAEEESITIAVNRQNFAGSRDAGVTNYSWQYSNSLVNTIHADKAQLQLFFYNTTINQLWFACANAHTGQCDVTHNNDPKAAVVIPTLCGAANATRTYTSKVFNHGSGATYYISGYSFKAVPTTTGIKFSKGQNAPAEELPIEGKVFTADASEVNPGTTFYYTATYTNGGNIRLEDFTITISPITELATAQGELTAYKLSKVLAGQGNFTNEEILAVCDDIQIDENASNFTTELASAKAKVDALVADDTAKNALLIKALDGKKVIFYDKSDTVKYLVGTDDNTNVTYATSAVIGSAWLLEKSANGFTLKSLVKGTYVAGLKSSSTPGELMFGSFRTTASVAGYFGIKEYANASATNKYFNTNTTNGAIREAGAADSNTSSLWKVHIVREADEKAWFDAAMAANGGAANIGEGAGKYHVTDTSITDEEIAARKAKVEALNLDNLDYAACAELISATPLPLARNTISMLDTYKDGQLVFVKPDNDCPLTDNNGTAMHWATNGNSATGIPNYQGVWELLINENDPSKFTLKNTVHEGDYVSEALDHVAKSAQEYTYYGDNKFANGGESTIFGGFSLVPVYQAAVSSWIEANVATHGWKELPSFENYTFGDRIGEYSHDLTYTNTNKEEYERYMARIQELHTDCSTLSASDMKMIDHCWTTAVNILPTLNPVNRGQLIHIKNINTADGEYFLDVENGTPTYTQNANNAIVYYSADGHLINLATGVAHHAAGTKLCNQVSSPDNKHADAAEFTFIPAGKLGAYNVTYLATAETATNGYLGYDHTTHAVTEGWGTGETLGAGDSYDKWNFLISEVESVPVAIHTDGYGAVVCPVALAVPDGVTAYVAKVDGNKMKFESVSLIPAGAHALIKAEDQSVNLPVADSDDAASTSDNLRGYHLTQIITPAEGNSVYSKVKPTAAATTDDNEEAIGAKLYRLDANEDGQVIVPAGTFAVEMATPKDNPESITVNPVGAEVTLGLEELSTINYQLSTIYDLQGRRLAAPAKGINIIGGRKVLVK